MPFNNETLFRKGRLKAPCNECPDRKQGCHAGCEKYQAYSKERKELYERNKYLDYSSRSKRRKRGCKPCKFYCFNYSLKQMLYLKTGLTIQGRCKSRPTPKGAKGGGMKCVICGREFSKRTSPKQITCSKECSKKRHMQMQKIRLKAASANPTHICVTCGKEFVTTSKHRSTVYCSDECNLRKMRAKEAAKKDVPCAFCGKVFHREYGQKKYCSVECRNAWRYGIEAQNRAAKREAAEKPRESHVDDINTKAREMGLSYGAFQALQWQQEHRYKIV